MARDLGQIATRWPSRSGEAAPVIENWQDLARDLQSGEARILRQIGVFPTSSPPPDAELRRGLFIDCETTGLEDDDEIIELAAVPFDFTRDGAIWKTDKPFQAYRQPSRPISAEITALTGITAEMVQGREIHDADIEKLLYGVHLVVAHNAEFDRGHCERLSPRFARKRWACSMSEVDWRGIAGYEGRTLGYLCMQAGFFYDRHRALADCEAGVMLLSLPGPISGETGMKHLLDAARLETCRVIADNSPFKLKGLLKARGYRWDGERRVWWRDVAEATAAAEGEWLRQEIYQDSRRRFQVIKLTAAERFSRRAWEAGTAIWL